MRSKITTLIALTLPLFRAALRKGFDESKEVMDPEEAELMFQDLESIDPMPLFEALFQDLTDAEADCLIACYSNPVYTTATEKASMASMKIARLMTEQLVKKSLDRLSLETALLRSTPDGLPN